MRARNLARPADTHAADVRDRFFFLCDFIVVSLIAPRQCLWISSPDVCVHVCRSGSDGESSDEESDFSDEDDDEDDDDNVDGECTIWCFGR